MGREVKCEAVIGRWRGDGKLLLETDELIFRGENRLVVARSDITGAAHEDGWLIIDHRGGGARFSVGRGVERWVDDIHNPKTLIDKLGVTAASRVAVVRVGDDAFIAQLRDRAAAVSTRLGAGPYDMIFYCTDDVAGLRRLEQLADRIEQDGAVWIITPKGVPALGHGPVIEAARRAGLVDVKTARFSDTHTSLKLVIPRAKRGKKK